jgi:2-methylaconitate cis-trans-isomerase PrpF
MRGVSADVVYAEGAPGPTLVLNRDELPSGSLASRAELTAVRRWLVRTGRGHIRKLGIYGASVDPAHDLDYRFVQFLPDGFDFRTGCGHSLLACVIGSGMPGVVRVRALTTGDTVECVPEPGGGSTVRLLRSASFDSLLPTGRPLERLCGVPVSMVQYGNPYVFVDAHELGLTTEQALFTAGPASFRRLVALREVAAAVLGYARHSALPKIAALGSYSPGRLSVRALTVPAWHPGIALTGATCLAAATAIPGTLPNRLAPPTGSVSIVTADVPVIASVTGQAGGLRSVAVHRKRAHIVERGLRLPWRIHVTA